MARDVKREADLGKLDLALASELQAALLPKTCPTDCPSHVIAARNRMLAGVGGDFYDFVRVNDDQMAILIGDVIGHGVRASLIMAQIMGFLRSQQRAILSRPGQIIVALNEMLIDLGNKIDSILSCSLLYAVIDAPTGVGFFANAGHPCPVICRDGRSESLGLGRPDIPLGVQKFRPSGACHTFLGGDRMVMFTDGVTDAANPAGQRFGDLRLHQAVNECLSCDPQDCADSIFRAADEFRQGAEQTDDEMVVVIDRL